MLQDLMQAEYENTTVEYVNTPRVDAVAQAQQIAADSRYSADYKREQITGLFETAAAETESRVAEQLESVERRLAEAQQRSVAQFAPKPEDAAALLYTREALAQRLNGMPATAVREMWQAAITGGDYITARVMADFLPSLHKDDKGNSALFPWYEEMRQSTEDMSLTADQRAARAEVRKLEATKFRVKNALAAARSDLGKKFAFNGNELMLEPRAALRQQVVGRF